MQRQQGYERVGARELTMQILRAKCNGTTSYNVTVILDDQLRPSTTSATPHRWLTRKRIKERKRARGAARRVGRPWALAVQLQGILVTLILDITSNTILH